tara:strand:- start:284 stop:481 length:198 start_codon:yes stop_codon:yes gene_type:complete
MNNAQWIFSIIVFLVYIGIPICSWLLLSPATFWQKMVMLGLTVIYGVVVGIIGFFGWCFGMEELD